MNNIIDLKIIKEAAIKGHKDQIKKVKKWNDIKLANKMEKMTIKVIKI